MPRSRRSPKNRPPQASIEKLEARQLLSGVAAATAAGYIWPNTLTPSIRADGPTVSKARSTTTNSTTAAKTSGSTSTTSQTSGNTTVTSAATATTYNRAAAVAYANANWNLVVSDGYFWINGSTAKFYGAGSPVPVNQPNEAGGIGDDCAHFVSSCIGTPGGGLTIPSRAGTYGEPGAARLDELLVGNSLGGYGTTYAYGTLVSSVSQLTPGDVIGYDWDGSGGGSMSGIDHTTIYIGNNEVDAHATSHQGANWTLGGATDYFFIHITLPDTNVPVAPTNSSPANNGNVASTTPKLTASTFSDAAPGSTQAAAQWQVYKSTTLVYDSGTDTTDKTSITIPSGKLTAGSAYTWKVRYQDSYGDWGAYSTATSFTIGTTTSLPSTPTNTSPANNANVSITPTLTSSAFSDTNTNSSQAAAEWKIFNGATLVYDSGVDATHLTSVTVPSGTLASGTTYTWQVRYEDNYSNWSSYSTATTFTTVDQPPVIASTMLTPSSGTVVQGVTAYISAGGVSDPDGTVANVQYYLESNGVGGLQTGASGDTLVQTSTDSSGSYLATLDTSALSTGSHTYYVFATDNQGATSTPLSVNLNVIPAVTNFTATPTSGVSMHLSWSGDPADATQFILQRSANGADFVQVATIAKTATSYDDTGLSAGTSYTYRILAITNGGSSTWVTSNAANTWKAGDATGDGKVDFNDFLVLQNNYGKPGGWLQGDFDGSGVVDFNDYLILQNAMTSG
jgi:hypothetical protein